MEFRLWHLPTSYRIIKLDFLVILNPDFLIKWMQRAFNRWHYARSEYGWERTSLTPSDNIFLKLPPPLAALICRGGWWASCKEMVASKILIWINREVLEFQITWSCCRSGTYSYTRMAFFSFPLPIPEVPDFIQSAESLDLVSVFGSFSAFPSLSLPTFTMHMFGKRLFPKRNSQAASSSLGHTFVRTASFLQLLSDTTHPPPAKKIIKRQFIQFLQRI